MVSPGSGERLVLSWCSCGPDTMSRERGGSPARIRSRVLPTVRKRRCTSTHPARWSKVGILSLLLLASVLLTGFTSDANERATRIFALQLRASDLPPGWQRDHGGRGKLDQEREGVISRFVSFGWGSDLQRAGVFVRQELIDYPSTNQAADAFADIVRVQIPSDAWTWPEQVDFRYQADKLEVACLQPSSLETTWCTAFAQYGNFVSIIYANVFEDRWLTVEDLERLLESIDKRMAATRDQP